MQNPLALDIGCGEGAYLEKLFRKGYATVGLDVNCQRLQIAKKTSAVVCASSSNLPFRGQAFDLVSMQYVIHHIKAPDDTLREVSRISKSNSVIDIAELVEDSLFQTYPRPPSTMEFLWSTKERQKKTKQGSIVYG